MRGQDVEGREGWGHSTVLACSEQQNSHFLIFVFLELLYLGSLLLLLLLLLLPLDITPLTSLPLLEIHEPLTSVRRS